MKNLLNKYLDFERKIETYTLALKTMLYDSSTIAPKNGNDYRNEKMAELSGEIFSIKTDETRYKILNDLKDSDLSIALKKQIFYQLEDLDKLRSIPKDRYIAYNLLINKAEKIWEDAKEHSDYRMFEPTLALVVEMTKEIYTYRDSETSLYERMLDDYEPESTEMFYDKFFSEMKNTIIPIILDLPTKVFSFAYKDFSTEKQKDFCSFIVNFLNFNSDSLYIGESSHPFSSSFSIDDSRITNRYNAFDFSSSIFSLIHELGHATYNSQVDREYQGMYIADNMSYGMHESQSRLYENQLGRQPAFWHNNYPKLQNLFSDQLKDIKVNDFIEFINYATPSPIRVEADELTYCIHIIIRYELEKGLFNGTYTTKDLDKVWNEKYHDYLGLTINNDSDGILQDIHWSNGSFGYFPTYALGSAYAAQFYSAMEKDLQIEKLLLNNRFDVINNWLKEKIHHDGGIYRSKEILLRATEEEFNPQYYINYLTKKFKGN